MQQLTDYRDITLGFVGIGTINKSMILGLCNPQIGDKRAKKIVISPRNVQNANELARDYPEIIKIAESNQDVVDKADWVIIGLRVDIIESEVQKLKFKDNQTIVNLAAMPSEKFEKCVQNKTCEVVRSCPLPSMALNVGAPLITPAHQSVINMFTAVGNPFVVNNNHEMYTMQGLACMMGPQYGLMNAVYQWLQEQNIEKEVALQYTAEMYNSIVTDALHKIKHQDKDFQDLINEQSKGGLNEANHQYMVQQDVYSHFKQVLDNTYNKMTKKTVQQQTQQQQRVQKQAYQQLKQKNQINPQNAVNSGFFKFRQLAKYFYRK